MKRMNKKQQIEEIEDIIKAEYKEWLDVTGVIPKGTTYYAECLGGSIDCAELLYKASYRKVPKGAVILTPEERDEEMKAQNEKQAELENEIYALKVKVECLEEYSNALEEAAYNAEGNLDNLVKEIEDLKAENERLTETLRQVLLSIDTVKEMNTMCNIDEQRKQAVKEFAEKLKMKTHNYYPSIDSYCISKKAVLVSEIDELLKEYEQ